MWVVIGDILTHLVDAEILQDGRGGGFPAASTLPLLSEFVDRFRGTSSPARRERRKVVENHLPRAGTADFGRRPRSGRGVVTGRATVVNLAHAGCRKPANRETVNMPFAAPFLAPYRRRAGCRFALVGTRRRGDRNANGNLLHFSHRHQRADDADHSRGEKLDFARGSAFSGAAGVAGRELCF